MKRFLIFASALLAVFAGASVAWAQQVDPFCGRSMMWGDSWYGWFLGPVMMILYIAVAVAVVVLIVRWLGGSGHATPATPPAPGQKDALDILKERFARGEIDKKEFEEKRQTLHE